jgi:hypothetical protein
MSDNGEDWKARMRRQQQNILRRLLKEGMTPEAIKREYPSDWTLEEIRALESAEEQEDA